MRCVHEVCPGVFPRGGVSWGVSKRRCVLGCVLGCFQEEVCPRGVSWGVSKRRYVQEVCPRVFPRGGMYQGLDLLAPYK